LASDFANAFGERIQSALEAHGPHFWTTSQKGEKWLQATCPFHDDKTPSFRYQPVDHVFYCHACARTFTPMEVANALHVDPPSMPKRHMPKSPVPIPPVLQVISSPPPPPVPERGLSAEPEKKTTKYEYRFPDGRLSHVVTRIEEGGSKEFPVSFPDGTPGLPKDHYPVYQPVAIQPGDYVVIVEGEKCVEAVEAVHDQLDHPVHALTWGGGSGSAKKYALHVAAHLQRLQPGWVTLWPDNDEPGYKAMEQMATTLRKLNMRYSVVAPNDLGLELRADVADYLAAGKSLAGALQIFRQEGSPEIAGLVAKTLMTRDEFMVVERRLFPLDYRRMDRIWNDAYGTFPKRDQLRELDAALQRKAQQAPIQVIYRTVADADSFYWRTQATGRCLRISAKGVEMADDPPGWVLVMRPEPDCYPAGYASGVKADLDAWLDRFRLNDTTKQLLEAWLCCTLLNLQTPLLLIRSPAGRGKTTLARSLLAIVEPSIPELPLTDKSTRDERGLVRALGLTRALLLDNVGSLPSGMEDMLSKLITGANFQIRGLYTDSVESLNYRRAIIMTTIGYDIYQSDLSDRTIALSAQLKTDNEWESSEDLKAAYDQQIEKIRGYIFSQCSKFYKFRATTPSDLHFRIGDLGRVLATLGYDTAQIAKDMRLSRQDLVAQHDVWLDTIVDLFRATNMDEWTVPTATLVREIGQKIEDTDISSWKLGRYLQEKEALFRDYGFTVETKRGVGGRRLWRFSNV
jgi:hypothetical protein